MCFFKAALERKVLSQPSRVQTYGREPVWKLRWISSWVFPVNSFLHVGTGQGNLGLCLDWPMWLLACSRMLSWREKCLPQCYNCKKTLKTQVIIILCKKMAKTWHSNLFRGDPSQPLCLMWRFMWNLRLNRLPQVLHSYGLLTLIIKEKIYYLNQTWNVKRDYSYCYE